MSCININEYGSAGLTFQYLVIYTQEFLKRHLRKDLVNFACIARHFCRVVRFANIGNCGWEVTEGKQQMALIVTTFKNHNLKSLIKHTTAGRVKCSLTQLQWETMITDLTQKNMERKRNLIFEYKIKSLLSKELGGAG